MLQRNPKRERHRQTAILKGNSVTLRLHSL